ncbi:MAG: hypothetical protein M1818_000127 [Claussenomyces sp. TS43310]|nr:MAG: hypothetical protein M1818_000127 [Claussenomyces sp. TS43310]
MAKEPDQPSDTAVEESRPLDGIKEDANAAAKAHKIETLTARNSALQHEIEALRAELELARTKLKNPAAAETVARHIKLLHAYNEIRDVGQGLMGLIADGRNVRAVEVYREFSVGPKD